jgi:hypothetical protein
MLHHEGRMKTNMKLPPPQDGQPIRIGGCATCSLVGLFAIAAAMVFLYFATR